MFKKGLKKIWRVCAALVSGVFWYSRDLFAYKKMLGKNKPGAFWFYPKIFDKDAASHTFDKHYVYMDRWAAKKIIAARPQEHLDVGSSIRFLSFVSAFVPLIFLDIRPVSLDFDNFRCMEGSVLKMPFESDSVKSLSCLHVAEHIGLGRYGDPLDPKGTMKACRELERVLGLGGRLYFALPVGRPAIYFNAHRVHDPEQVLSYFPKLRLLGFSAVSDQGRFIRVAKIEDFKHARYACGMFEFAKDAKS